MSDSTGYCCFRQHHCCLTPLLDGTLVKSIQNKTYWQKLELLACIFAGDSIGIPSFKYSWEGQKFLTISDNFRF